MWGKKSCEVSGCSVIYSTVRFLHNGALWLSPLIDFFENCFAGCSCETLYREFLSLAFSLCFTRSLTALRIFDTILDHEYTVVYVPSGWRTGRPICEPYVTIVTVAM